MMETDPVVQPILAQVVAGQLPDEGQSSRLNGVEYKMQDGILRDLSAQGVGEEQLAEFYHKHWTLEGAYDDRASDEYQAEIFKAMFEENFTGIGQTARDGTAVLDFGCGSGVAGRVYFAAAYDKVRYVGVDMSRSVEQAKQEFVSRGLRLVGGGTDTHLMLVDLSVKDLTGKAAEGYLDEIGITVNKNAIPYDKQKPFVASGIRIGTPAITSRGFGESECREVARIICDALDDIAPREKIEHLHGRVHELTNRFAVP